MRLLLAFLLLLVPACAQAQTAAALLSQDKQDLACTKPDRILIRQETALGTVWSSPTGNSKKYNEQTKGFNDCTRVYVENANREVTRIRDAARARLDQIGADATAHIRIVERQINAAIEEAKAVDSLEPLPSPAYRLTEAGGFPPPECSAPDSRLVIPLPHARDNSARDRKYDGQKLVYGACMRAWIALAKAEIRQIDADAHADMKPVAGDANRQILEINATIVAALEEARTASLEQAMALNALKASLAPPPQPGSTESVVVTDAHLPRQADTPDGVGDPGAIVCRARQQLTDSRLWGPEICKRNREWAELYKRGVQMSSDGQALLDSEKRRTFNPQTCLTFHSVNGPPASTVLCTGGP